MSVNYRNIFLNPSSSTYSISLDPQSLIVGSTFYVQISWSETFSSSMPVKFYVTECTVSDTKDPPNTYSIIKYACGSDLVQVERISEPYVVDKLQYSYKSFSFETITGTYDLKFACTLQFCLQADIDSGACGYNDGDCLDQYSWDNSSD